MALLSAAELHGAAHNRPQAFQVMVTTNRRAIECGQVRVQFIARKDMKRTPVIEKSTPRGPLRVASPEATALELVGYASTVLAELAEVLDPKRLVATAADAPVAWAQRLGYLLDLTERRDLADALAQHVKTRAHVPTPLVRSITRAGARVDERWNPCCRSRKRLSACAFSAE